VRRSDRGPRRRSGIAVALQHLPAPLDRVWDAGRHGVLVRYCDDLVVMLQYPAAGRGRLGALRLVLAGLGLELKGG